MVFFIYTLQAFRRKNVRLGDVFELILVQKREESEVKEKVELLFKYMNMIINDKIRSH